MEEYYRHFKGNIYKIICIAHHSETQEELVIYQSINGNQGLWARPKEMFYDKVLKDGILINRFTRISKREALENNIKYNFPNIDYKDILEPLIDNKHGFSKSVRSMITLLSHRNIISSYLIQDFKNDDDIEWEILNRISSYDKSCNIEEIFHLIQIWGGISGRGIYVFADKFNWKIFKIHYEHLVETCLNINVINEKTIKELSKVVIDTDKAIKNFGTSFITKHVRFWLFKSLKYNALPIYDSIMAKSIMNKNSAQAIHLEEYWKAMHEKSLELKIDLMPLERQIFKYEYKRNL